MMFLGGLILAIGVETSGLHRRIALRMMLLIGTSPRRIMLSCMLATAFLSMWISNTATTAMMLPIVEAVCDALPKVESNWDKTSADYKYFYQKLHDNDFSNYYLFIFRTRMKMTKIEENGEIFCSYPLPIQLILVERVWSLDLHQIF